MRHILPGLTALAVLATAARSQTPPAAPDAAPPPTAPATPAPAPPALANPAPAPAPQAPTTEAPSPPAATPQPVPGAAAEAPTPAPEAPSGPPPAPTDPVAIALITALQTVCVPAVDGGNISKIAKAAGYRKSGENYVYKQPTFQFTVEAPGSNPTQCHVDIVHPIYAEAPAAPLTVALHNWAAVSRGWTLYRNDKNEDAGQQFITRSWEHSADGKNEALVLTTVRKADGSPMRRDADTSMMIYSVNKTPA